MPRRRLGERLREDPTGSRHSRRGSRSPESHSKVAEVMRKKRLKEEGSSESERGRKGDDVLQTASSR